MQNACHWKLLAVEINGIELPTLAEGSARMSMLLWGPAGAGKTVLACSAPGQKLLINFDPDGPNSLGAREDIVLIDLSSSNHAITEKFTADDPLLPLSDKSHKLSAILDAGINTVVVDSCSAYSQLAVERGISVTKGATLERPSPGAYGARNALTLRMMTAILRLTGKRNINVIFITHEDDAGVRNSDGELLHITMLIGGKLASQTALQISEVWHINDTGKERKIMVRPGRNRKPMKTRMFDTTKGFEFTSRYNQFSADAPYGLGSLDAFVKEWEANGRNKIPIPG